MLAMASMLIDVSKLRVELATNAIYGSRITLKEDVKHKVLKAMVFRHYKKY